ncbi:MAG: PAS domain S-box protein [Scytonematopsis contorta HA4267-MV1]|jgi:PAS domain S-box-containing protein|nr:PAS domain S-box protein [Scytonematopsis contorta HA4267-MV1]
MSDILTTNRQNQSVCFPNKPSVDEIKSRDYLIEGIAIATDCLQSVPDLETSIDKASSALGKALGVDKVYIFEYHSHPTTGELAISQRWEWIAEGILPGINNLAWQNLAGKDYCPRWYELFLQGKVISGLVKDFPVEEQEILESQEICSVLAVPIQIKNKLWGFIQFDNYHSPHQWSSSEQIALKSVALTFGAAIEREQTELKLIELNNKLETQIRTNENNILFRNLVENANDIFYCLSSNMTFSYLSPYFTDLLGYQIEEFIGNTFIPIVHPDDVQACIKFIQAGFETGEKQAGLEFRGKHKNGSMRWLTANSSPIKDIDGKVVGVQGIVRDITERKEAEEILYLREQQLRTVISSAPLILFALDNQGRFTLSDGKGLQAMGLQPEQVVGQNVYDMYHDYPKILADIDQALTGQEMTTYPEIAGMFFESHFCPIRNDSGEVIGVTGVSVDITERKRSEQLFEEQAQREELLNLLTKQIRSSLDFEEILENTLQEVRDLFHLDSCCFAWYCCETEEPYWDCIKEAHLPDIPKTTGHYPIAKVRGLTVKLLQLKPIEVPDVEIETDLDIREVLQMLGLKASLMIPMQVRAGSIAVINCMHYNKTRDWSDAEIELMQSVMGQLAIALNQAELYTQSKAKAIELEKTLTELQQTQTQMIQSEKMSSLGQMVAGVAHEINNPVNFIHGNLTHACDYTEDLLRLVQLYQQNYPQPVSQIEEELEAIDFEFLQKDLTKLLKSMKVGTERIREIVKSLRTFSRLDEAECKNTEIHEGIDSTLMILQNRLKPKQEYPGIEVFKEYGKLPVVQCYAGQLNQVFMNILANAIDALEERDQKRTLTEIQENPSTICIKTELIEKKQAVSITICDNGLGIPQEIQNRIFDPFFTTKTVGKGTGLGMSISYQIITERHKGSFKCVSSPGSGACFVIQIPITQGMT